MLPTYVFRGFFNYSGTHTSSVFHPKPFSIPLRRKFFNLTFSWLSLNFIWLFSNTLSNSSRSFSRLISYQELTGNLHPELSSAVLSVLSLHPPNHSHSTGAQTGPHWIPLSLWKFPHSPWLLNPYLHPLTPFRPCSLALDPLNGKWGGGKGEGIRTTHYLSCPTPVTLNVCCQGAKQYSPSLCATVDWDIANSITKAWSIIY